LKYYVFRACTSCQYATKEHRTTTNPNPNVVQNDIKAMMYELTLVAVNVFEWLAIDESTIS